jgi:UDP-3-O-[3-hydroxymyristoyl] glucosamine N-acyltransferase
MAQSYTLNELALFVDGEVIGDGELIVSGLNGIEHAAAGEITFLTDAKKAGLLAGCGASACIVPTECGELDLPCIRVGNPDLAAALIHNRFLAGEFVPRGVLQPTCIGSGCHIPDEVAIGPMACIGDRVKVGSRVTMYPGVVIGSDVIIGDDTVLYANVSIADRSVIGSRVIIHANTSIGSDGFGYATDKAGNHVKKPQVGNVRIDDDVEIGANSSVDRAAFGTTRIRRGAKIDNQVMVAHNVDVGENCILVGQVGIAGSTTLGKNVVLGARAGLGGHLNIGDQVMVAAMGGVHSNLKAGSVVGGAPAIEIKKWGRAAASFARLPEMLKDIRRLKRTVEKLAHQVKDTGEEPDKEREKE